MVNCKLYQEILMSLLKEAFEDYDEFLEFHIGNNMVTEWGSVWIINVNRGFRYFNRIYNFMNKSLSQLECDFKHIRENYEYELRKYSFENAERVGYTVRYGEGKYIVEDGENYIILKEDK